MVAKFAPQQQASIFGKPARPAKPQAVQKPPPPAPVRPPPCGCGEPQAPFGVDGVRYCHDCWLALPSTQSELFDRQRLAAGDLGDDDV